MSTHNRNRSSTSIACMLLNHNCNSKNDVKLILKNVTKIRAMFRQIQCVHIEYEVSLHPSILYP